MSSTESNLLPERLKTLRTDNGGECLSNDLKRYFEEHGIKHQLTIAYIPQQNGVAERMNRTILDLVRSMLLSSHLSKDFWAEALATAVYVRNRVSTHTLPSGETSYHRWMRKSPNLAHIRLFCRKCLYILPKVRTSNLDSRSKPGTIIGYSTQGKGYKNWDAELKSIVVSRDVRFDELHNRKQTSSLEDSPEDSASVLVRRGEVENQSTDDTNSDSSTTESAGSESEEEFEDAKNEPAPTLRRSTRVRKLPGEWYKGSGHYAQALSAQTFPTSYRIAISPENIEF